MDKTINKIPSFASVRRHAHESLNRESKLLVNSLAILRAYKTAYLRHQLPADFYNACQYGPIPRDAWLLHNAEYMTEQIAAELSRRKFEYCIWIDLPRQKAC